MEAANVVQTFTLDFASPEATCQKIVTAGELLADQLFAKTCELGEAKIALDKAEGEVGLRAFASGAKVTGDYLKCVQDSDGDVVGLRQRVERLSAGVQATKAALENIDRAYGLFKTWMQGQRPAGLNER